MVATDYTSAASGSKGFHLERQCYRACHFCVAKTLSVVMICNADVQLCIQGFLLAADLKATASMSNSWAVSARSALYKRSQWLLEDYVDLTWCDLRVLLSKARNLKVLEIDAHALVAQVIDDEESQSPNYWEDVDWEPQLGEARGLIADVVRRNELLHVDVCNNSFNDDRLDEFDYDFIDLLGPVAGQLLSLRTETSDFNMDLVDILQACGQLQQLDVPNLSLARLFHAMPPDHLPALPMVEKLRVRDVDADLLTSLLTDAYGAFRERLPRLQAVYVGRRMQRKVPKSVLDEARLAIHIQPCVVID